MKPILKQTLLFSLFVFVISTDIKAQWQPCLGIEGGYVGNIIQSDSFLFTTSANTIYRTDTNFITTWVKSTELAGGGYLFVYDSCIFSYGIMHGMLRSFDNGLTWNQDYEFSYTNTMCSVDSVIFFCDNIYLYKSYDFLETSEKITILQIERPYVWSYNDSLLFVSDMHGEGMFQSLDTGENWDAITDAGLPSDDIVTYNMTCYNNTIWICGDYGVYYLNPDRTTWIESNTGIPEGIKVIEMNLFNSELYCSPKGIGLFKFDNDNLIWEYIDESPTTIGSVNEINDELYCGTSNGAFKMDSSFNWYTNLQGLYHRHISSLSVLLDTIYVFANNELFKSYDEGNYFEKIETIKGRQIIATDSVFYSLSYTNMLLSRDYGALWDTITYGLQKHLIHLSITNNYYYICSSYGLFRSRVDTINWFRLENGLSTWTINYFEVIDSVVIVNDYSERLVCISKDYGDTFDTLLVTDGHNFPIKKIDDRFYILNGTMILYSDDLGVTWEEITAPYNTLSLDQNDDYLVIGGNFVASNSVLSISYDNGQTWASIVDNLPWAFYGSYNNITFYNQRLFTSSAGNSLWYRDDILTEIPEVEIINHDKVRIFPNPVSDIITVVLLSKSKDCQFRIFDIQGREQINGTLNMKKTNIDLGKLKPGIYIIEILTASGKASRKIIKY